MGGDACLFRAIGAVHLVAYQEGDHGAAGGAGIHRDVEAVLLEEAALLADVEGREAGIDAGGDGQLDGGLRPRRQGRW